MPDPPQVLHAAVRSAVTAAGLLAKGLPIFAGGKSMGGRMTSQAQSDRPLADVRGLVFVGFPLHPVGDPGTARADHLHRIAEPMLFLQGTKDRLANPELLKPVLARLGDRAHVEWLDDGDHDFKVPVRGGLTRAQTLDWIAERTVVWMRKQRSEDCRLPNADCRGGFPGFSIPSEIGNRQSAIFRLLFRPEP